MLHRILLLLSLPLVAICAAAQGAPDASRFIVQGDSLLEANQPSRAMQKYNKAVELGATANALAARARGWYYQGKYTQFLADVNRALALDSLHPQANFQRALYASRTDDHAASIRFTTRALKTAKKPELQRQALILRGSAEAASGRNQQAIADLKLGITDRTDDPVAMKLLARMLDEAGDMAGSLAMLEKLCTIRPDDIGNWSNKGYELNRLERYSEALNALDKALEIDKDEPVVLSNKAYALLQLDRDADAMASVNRSLKGDAANPFALRTRALLYLRKGERDKACNDLSLAKAMGASTDVDDLIKQHCAGLQPKR
ncbi:MAG: tetratricopeptide repeat protein [Bacteroidetes bacterium]|nr:tetratricopeptide repeat protein [Bacteroidota bacterium]MBS1942796.1 tetratricopeptide repeat protein [Bacteroidota bacterium]